MIEKKDWLGQEYTIDDLMVALFKVNTKTFEAMMKCLIANSR